MVSLSNGNAIWVQLSLEDAWNCNVAKSYSAGGTVELRHPIKVIQVALVASLPQIIETRNTSLHGNFHLPLLCVTFLLKMVTRGLVIEQETLDGTCAYCALRSIQQT